jgi:hypothetical protein
VFEVRIELRLSEMMVVVFTGTETLVALTLKGLPVLFIVQGSQRLRTGRPCHFCRSRTYFPLKPERDNDGAMAGLKSKISIVYHL